MDETYSYTYFSITSNGEYGKYGLESTNSGVFDPDEITALLDIEPFRKWKKGDNRRANTPYGFSSWSAEKNNVDRLNITNQCLDTIKNLKHKIPELMKIKSTYDVNFKITVVPHIYKEESPIMIFDKEIIEFCYLTGTIIDVDMYVYQFDESIN